MVPTEPHLITRDVLFISWRTPYWSQFRKMCRSLPVQSVASHNDMTTRMIRTIKNKCPWRMCPVPNCYVQLRQTQGWSSNPALSAPQTMHWPKCTRKERRQNKVWAEHCAVWPYENSQSSQICPWVPNSLSPGFQKQTLSHPSLKSLQSPHVLLNKLLATNMPL